MSVWFAIPSARPPEQVEPVLCAWRERGYNISVWSDEPNSPKHGLIHAADYITSGPYPGYAIAVNLLALDIIHRLDPACDWIVTGGDDTLPDPNHSAEEIARECSWHFFEPHWIEAELHSSHYSGDERRALETFGIMQPTGDRDFGDSQGPYIDRLAGSPWMGREWCLRANQGKGPLYPGFTHMFVDECLQEVATKLGVFWQRPDLVQRHEHWGRPREGEKMGQADRMPEHAKKWNTRAHWDEAKALLVRLRADGFRECMPL
jgi:hypothetical protein